MPAFLRIARAIASTALAAGLMAAIVSAPLTGCGEEEQKEVAPPPPPPPPPPPEKPKVTPVAQLMKELGISAKIRLPEEKAPPTDPERVAVLKFFDGFAKGTAATIKPAMAEKDRMVLELMDKSGAFAKATAAADRIDLNTGTVEGKSYVMAVFRVGDSFEPQLWQFTVEGEGRTVTKQSFDSYIQPIDVMNKISGAKLIDEWIKLVAAERKMADEPDETFKPAARVQAQEKAEESSGSDEPKGPIGAPPMKNRPTGPPIKPPGPGGPGGN